MSAPTISAPPAASPRPAAPTSPCTWASCDEPSRATLDGWRFCLKHATTHRYMSRRGEIRGQDLALTKDVDPRPNAALTRDELLRALLVEAARPVPPPLWQIERARQQPRAGSGRRPARRAA